MRSYSPPAVAYPSFPSLVGEGVGVGSVISSLVGQYRPHPQPLPLRGGESGWAILKRAGRAVRAIPTRDWIGCALYDAAGVTF